MWIKINITVKIKILKAKKICFTKENSILEIKTIIHKVNYFIIGNISFKSSSFQSTYQQNYCKAPQI